MVSYSPLLALKDAVGHRAGAILALLMALSVLTCNPLLAQDEDVDEFAPVNLSLSGAASASTIIRQPDGGLRILWWDHFDGITIVEGQLGDWSDPQSAPIILVEASERPTPEGENFTYTPIAAMPYIVGDATGTAHALWLGEVDEETGGRPLRYARMAVGQTSWTTPRVVATSAASFRLVDDDAGALHLVYIRDLDTSTEPAGLYYRRSDDGGNTWDVSVAVNISRYYRLLNAEEADLNLFAGAPGSLFVTWHDPHLGQLMLAGADEDGWRDPVWVGQPDRGTRRGHFLSTSRATSDTTWLLWEETGYGTGCSLRQAPLTDLLNEEGEGEPVLPELVACPEPDAVWFLPFNADEVLMAAGGEGGTTLFALWNGQRWSELQRLRLDFVDPRRDVPVYLSNVHIAPIATPGGLPDDRSLIFTGLDDMNDLWLVNQPLSALELAFASPSPWTPPLSVSQSQTAPASPPAVVADAEGRVHVLWPEAASPEQGAAWVPTVLWYARWDNGRWSRPVVVLRSPEGGARAPSLVVSDDYLHTVWCGGAYDRILYSRAFVQDAYATQGWLEPQAITGDQTVGSSVVGGGAHLVAAGGRLHVAYAVSVNEQRGIFYTFSEDGGDSWITPRVVFDAGAAGWASVGAPRLAVDMAGGLHIVWMRSPLTVGEPPHGVYYSWSNDDGVTWREALPVVEGAYARPQVSVNGLNQVHLLWQDVERGGVWWHRWLADASAQSMSAEGWAGWSRDGQVAGLRDVVGTVAVMPDGDGHVHLTGLRAVDETNLTLVHLLWDGGRWEPQASLDLDFAPGEIGVAAALQPEVGHLDLLFAGQAPSPEVTPQPELWHTGRTVTPAAAMALAAPGQSTTPTPAPTVTPAPQVTPTPDLRGGPPPAPRSSSLPFSMSVFWSGGVAVLVVVVVLGARFVWTARRSP
jgi:hypothetical protein